MTQIQTYGSGRKSDAQKVADEERKRESAQIAERKRQETLSAGADAAIKKVAAEIVLEKEKNRIPPDVDVLMKHAEAKKAQRDADIASLAKHEDDSKRDKKTFYRGAKMMFGAAMKDMARSQETARIASRLGVSNPITSGVMGVGQASGMIQHKVRFVEAVCKRFASRYRAIGHISAEDFESPVGT